jgi:hypothetical protein
LPAGDAREARLGQAFGISFGRGDGDTMTGLSRNLVLAFVLALGLSACGKKSDLQRPLPPPDVPKDAKGKVDPDRPFILDPLLR